MLKTRKQNADEGSVSISTKEGQGETNQNHVKDLICDFPVADNVMISTALCFENDHHKLSKSEHTLEHGSIPLAVYSKRISRRHSYCDDLVALRHNNHTDKQEIEQHESVEYLSSNAEMKSVNGGYANNDPWTNNKRGDKATKLQDLKWSQICASLHDTNTPIQSERAETLRKAMTILECNTDRLQVRPQRLRKTNSCHDLIDRHAHHPTKAENKQPNQFRSDELATSVVLPQNISKSYTETNESSFASLGFDVVNSLSNSLSKGVAFLSFSRLRKEPGMKLDIEFPLHGRRRSSANSTVSLDDSISSTSTTTSKDNNESTKATSLRRCKIIKPTSRRVERIIRNISPRPPLPSVARNVTHICTGTKSNDEDTQQMLDLSIHLPPSPGNLLPERCSSDEDQNFLNGLLFLSHNKGIEIKNLMSTSLLTNNEQVHPTTT